jgi:Formyl transferase
MRILLTAGFDAALHAVAIAELARRGGHEVVGVIVVHALQAGRVRAWVRKRGVTSVVAAARRWAGSRRVDSRDAAMDAFLREHAVVDRSLSRWCRAHGVPRCAVSDVNNVTACTFVRGASADRVVYAGGGILREPFLEAAGGRVLNAHSGPLPEVRGMNACEWSLLLGHDPAVTIHWIDRGIDTGAELHRIPIPIVSGDRIEDLRGRCTVAGVVGLLRALSDPAPPFPARTSTSKVSRQCFTLAPALRELVEARLAERARRGEP